MQEYFRGYSVHWTPMTVRLEGFLGAQLLDLQSSALI